MTRGGWLAGAVIALAPAPALAQGAERARNVITLQVVSAVNTFNSDTNRLRFFEQAAHPIKLYVRNAT